MNGHYIRKCVHDRVVEQCRCPGPKLVQLTDCPPSCDADRRRPMDDAVVRDQPEGTTR